MSRHAIPVIGAAVLIGLSFACTSNLGTPLTPTPSTSSAGADGSTLKVTAPVPISPTGDQQLTAGGSTLTLTATAATGLFTTAADLMYRFEVLTAAGTQVIGPSLLSSPSAQVSISALLASTRYTWHVRAESNGYVGPWSTMASFVTADTPPDPFGDYIGTCGGLRKADLMTCVNSIHKGHDEASDFEVVKRVAWILRNEGGGLLVKTSGDNIVTWRGYSLSTARVCQPLDHFWKVYSDAGAGGKNGAQWVDNGPVSASGSFCVPAMDPSLP